MTVLPLTSTMNRAEKSNAPRIWFVGPLPPPLSGQSHYNRTFLTMLDTRAFVTRLDTGGTVAQKIRAALFNTWTVLAHIRHSDTVYTSAPGQMGLWAFLPVIAALRLRGMTHFIHHHSFRAINLAPVASHRLLACLGGTKSRHVFLSETMRERYVNAYLSPAQAKAALVVPNAFLFAQEITELPHRNGPVTIGHLSVMTRRKGVDYFLTLIDRLLPNTNYRFVLAGPINDQTLRQDVETVTNAHPGRVKWIGPVEGAAKAEFYARTDIFVLPSRLIDEADPLVLLESFAAGSAVLASKRGCIPERVMEAAHLLEMEPEADTIRLNALADAIAADRLAWATRCQDHARRLCDQARARGDTFIEALGIR